jgi:hypothetical protein
MCVRCCDSVSCVATMMVVDDAVRRLPHALHQAVSKERKNPKNHHRRKNVFFFFFLFLFPSPSFSKSRGCTPGCDSIRLSLARERSRLLEDGHRPVRGDSLSFRANGERCFLVARSQSQSQLAVAAAVAVPCRLFFALSHICSDLRAPVAEAWEYPRDVFEKFRLEAGPLSSGRRQGCAAALSAAVLLRASPTTRLIRPYSR